MSNLVKVEEGLKALDLTMIIKFTKKLEDIGQGFNGMLAPVYLRDFLVAYDCTNILHAKAMKLFANADSALETAEAIAYFENAPEYLESKGVKDTDAARKRYVPLDTGVQQAKDARAKAEAMCSMLRNKMQEFRLAHDDVKKIAYAGDYNDSPNEGM